MSLSVSTKIDSVTIDVNFEGKLNILIGDSSTGKTYLLNTLYNYLSECGYNVEILDYRNKNITENMLADYGNKGIQVLLIDNADLIMNHELFRLLQKYNYTVVASLKNRFMVSGIKGVRNYYVIFDNSSLKLKRGV